MMTAIKKTNACTITIFRPSKKADAKHLLHVLKIDSDDFLLYQRYTIHITKQGDYGKYRIWCRPINNYLHRIITKACKGFYVDHINGNPLDNRKANLRIVNNKDNCKNTTSHKDSKYSIFKGVSYWNNPSTRLNRWVAQIKVDNVRKKAYFYTEVEAANQYNLWAKELHGEFSVMNDLGNRKSTWDEDLLFGNNSEKYLYELFQDKLELLDGIVHDLKIKSTGEYIQLKADRRSDKDTGNLFIEEFSNIHTKTIGGPFDALKKGTKYFAYMFTLSDTIYLYNTSDLVAFINKNIAEFRRHTVKSTKSNAAGILVPISSLKDLELDFYKTIS